MEVRSSRVYSLFSLFVLSCCFAVAQPQVWIAPSLHRVGMTDGSNEVTQAALYGTRGATDSFQIVIPRQQWIYQRECKHLKPDWPRHNSQ